MEQGLYLPKRFFSLRIWRASRVLSECEAWIDLVEQARFEATVTIECIGGREIEYGRGQYPASIRFLTDRWGWVSSKKTRCFLDKMKNDGEIECDCSQGMNIITICHYDEYRPQKGFSTLYNPPKGTAKGTAKGKPNGIEDNKLQEARAQRRAQRRANVDTPRAQYICTRDNISYNNKSSYINISDSDINNLGTSKEVLPSGNAEHSHPGSLDYDKLVEFFNTETHGVFGRIRMPISAIRRGQLAARAREMGKDAIAEVFKKAYKSDFLKGQNSRGWHATFDWLIKPTNFEKVLSGNYDNNDNSRPSSPKSDEDLLRNVAEGIARGRLAREQRGEQY